MRAGERPAHPSGQGEAKALQVAKAKRACVASPQLSAGGPAGNAPPGGRTGSSDEPLQPANSRSVAAAPRSGERGSKSLRTPRCPWILRRQDSHPAIVPVAEGLSNPAAKAVGADILVEGFTNVARDEPARGVRSALPTRHGPADPATAEALAQ